MSTLNFWMWGLSILHFGAAVWLWSSPSARIQRIGWVLYVVSMVFLAASVVDSLYYVLNSWAQFGVPDPPAP